MKKRYLWHSSTRFNLLLTVLHRYFGLSPPDTGIIALRNDKKALPFSAITKDMPSLRYGPSVLGLFVGENIRKGFYNMNNISLSGKVLNKWPGGKAKSPAINITIGDESMSGLIYKVPFWEKKDLQIANTIEKDDGILLSGHVKAVVNWQGTDMIEIVPEEIKDIFRYEKVSMLNNIAVEDDSLPQDGKE